jgi:hypothetical protein
LWIGIDDIGSSYRAAAGASGGGGHENEFARETGRRISPADRR